MVRDAVANVVERLRENGFEPRKVGSDSWEAQLPGTPQCGPCVFAITRDPFDQVVLVCPAPTGASTSRSSVRSA